jgi:hypothetical protein
VHFEKEAKVALMRMRLALVVLRHIPLFCG